MKRMPERDPGFWASLLAWLYAHKNDAGLAGISGVIAILRASYYAKDSWPKRLIDAALCATFSFFLKPTLQVVGQVCNVTVPDDTAWPVAIFIGAVGTDYILTKMRAFADKKLGSTNADTQ
jgi:lambda family phage holin